MIKRHIQFFQHPLRHRITAIQIMISIHQYFGLDNGDDIRFLTDGGITSQRMAIGHHTGGGGAHRIDFNHRAPFGKARTQIIILLHALAQPIKTSGNFFTRKARHVLCAHIHLDAGDRPGIADQIDQRGTIGCLLAQGFIIKDHPGNAVLHGRFGAKQHFAPVPAIIGGGLCANTIKTFFDGAGAFIGSQNTLAFLHHGSGGFTKCIKVHWGLHL